MPGCRAVATEIWDEFEGRERGVEFRNMTRSPAKRTRVVRRAESERDDKYFSKVIGKALDIMAILRASSQPLSLNELTLRVGLAKSSVFRMLHTLEVSGYLERDPAGHYAVSAGVRAWGRDQFLADVIETAHPIMRGLISELSETVSLAMRFENRIEVVASIESPQLIRMGNTVGRILPPHASSLGKAITAYQTDGVRERLIRSYGLNRFTSHTIVDEVALKAEYERICKCGYSIDAEESVLEGRCFGAPVFAPKQEVFAALSISMPKMRVRDKQGEARLVNAVRRGAAEITERMAATSRATA
ncbi:MAG: IclR family transcriptional regulator [Vicinamibacteraceae bacterium]